MYNDIMESRAASGGANQAPLLQLRVAYLSMEPRTGLTNFLDQLDGRLITHVILAFARVDPISGQLYLNRPADKLYLSQVGPFKSKYPHVRVLISINNDPPEMTSTLRAPRGSTESQQSISLNQQANRIQANHHASKSSSLIVNNDHHNTDRSHDESSDESPGSNTTNDLHHLHNSHSTSPFISVGAFNKLAQSRQLRQKFARSAMEFLKRYSLDGVDIDWEFPNFPHYFGINREYERTGLTKIIMELRSAIVEDFFDRQVSEQHQQQQSHSNNHHQHHHNHNNLNNDHHHASRSINNLSADVVKPHLLTLAIGAQDAILRFSYELKLLSNLIDWFNVMSYDYYMFKAYSPFTGPNSPLRPIVEPYVPVLGKLSFQTTLTRLLATDEIDRDKIIMGIPTYARAYRLLFKNTHPAPLTLAYGSRPGLYSSEYLSYEEVCEMLTKPETVVDFDKRAQVPYLLTDDGYTWVSYENEQSIKHKVDLIIEHQLGGYMTWNLNSDYFHSKTKNNVARKSDTSSKDDSKLTDNENNSDFIDNFPLHRALFEAAKGNKLTG